MLWHCIILYYTEYGRIYGKSPVLDLMNLEIEYTSKLEYSTYRTLEQGLIPRHLLNTKYLFHERLLVH